MEQVREAGGNPMTPRQKARKAGAKQYEGRPCQRCGGTTRYTSGGACTACVKARAKQSYDRLPMKPRQKDWGTQYEGNPCKCCGGTTRYANGGACVACMKARSKRRYDSRPKVGEARGAQYEGSPCKRCGGTARYANSDACVACTKAKAKQRHDRLPQEERDQLAAEWRATRQQFAKDYGRMTLTMGAGGLDAYLARLDKARQDARARYIEGQKAADSRFARATRKLVPGGRGEARHRAEYEEELKRLDKELEREYKRLDGWEKRARAYYLEKGCGTRT